MCVPRTGLSGCHPNHVNFGSIGIIPHPLREINGVEIAEGAAYFVAEKIGLDTCTLRGDEEDSNEGE